MNWRVVRIACVSALFCFLVTSSFSQNYYVVVGAFSTEKDDVKEFRSYLPGQQLDTLYTVDENNNLMHFYVLKTSSKEMAVEKSLRLQEALASAGTSSGSKDSFAPEKTLTAAPITEPDFGFTTASSSSSGHSEPIGAGAPPKPKGKYFKFMINAPNGNHIPTQVHHVDLEQGKELGSFDANSYIDVNRPGRNRPMTLVCGVFGYKEIEKYIDFSNPSETDGAYQDENGAWVIPYSLERLEKGDVSVMYNVGFHPDAVMMIPTSKGNLDELVDLMKTNPNYVIKVHAHCNGKGTRNILIMGSSDQYFNTEGAVEKKATAKELTNLRADAVRSYLVANGIDEARIKTYGWGATEMLVDHSGPYSKINDRIEIEILKD
jgi:outer membrane protein OmpA-like peptidoglycan-associated protein